MRATHEFERDFVRTNEGRAEVLHSLLVAHKKQRHVTEHMQWFPKLPVVDVVNLLDIMNLYMIRHLLHHDVFDVIEAMLAWPVKMQCCRICKISFDARKITDKGTCSVACHKVWTDGFNTDHIT